MEHLFVDMEVVCGKLGIELRSEGRRLVGLCPFHSETRPSFNVFLETNSFFCFSCKAGGDPLRLVSAFVDEVQTWWDLIRWYTADISPARIPIRVTPPLDRVKELFSTPPVELPAADVSKDPFLASLGILYASSGRLAGRHIIPVTLRGTLIAYEARDFVGGTDPKVLILPPAIRIHSYLWNIDNVLSGSPIIVVEGVKDAIAVLKFGYPNVVSSFGAKLSSDQVVLLMTKQPPEVTVAYDADSAGAAGAREAVAEMLAWTEVYVVSLPTGSDPWDVTKDVWQDCLSSRERVSAESRNSMILSEFRERIFM